MACAAYLAHGYKFGPNDGGGFLGVDRDILGHDGPRDGRGLGDDRGDLHDGRGLMMTVVASMMVVA
ncbi:hypothetical protein JCM19039_961 [Geomicrobium sp. JCM 19039]|nr:hypothetical protein JCM19039_961 [Geomicrobium sp. JCM 19039]